MKPALRIAVLLLLSGCTLARCQDRKDLKGVLQVVAEGAGQNRDEAIKDALRNAVRQAIGTFVDTVSQVENDRVIRDSILLYSDGFVERYEILPDSTRMEGGVYRLSVSADVKKKNLVESLKKAKVSTGEIDGKNLFAEAATKHEADITAEALALELLSNFPEQVVKVETIGKPRIVRQDLETAVCEITFQVSIDPDSYSSFHGRLVEFLKEVSTYKKRETAQFEKLGPESVHGEVAYQIKKSEDFRQLLASTKGAMVVALCNPTRKPGERLDFQFFALDEKLHRVFRKIPDLRGEFIVDFLNEQGVSLMQRTFSTREGNDDLANSTFGSRGLRTTDSDNFLVVFAPTFSKSYVSEPIGGGGAPISPIQHRPCKVFTRQVELPLQKLKDLAKLQIQTQYADLSDVLNPHLGSQPKERIEKQQKGDPSLPTGGGIF